MTPPASPGGEGPTQAPPHLPPGWIAQWDANSKKYYYVQLSTGVSQWDIPTEAAPVGGTPAPVAEHPYGAPGGGQPELITHPDGSQTVKHADGRMEPVMPDENGNARAMGDGQTGDRGLGSMAMNALLGGSKQSGNHGGSSNNLGGLASQVFNGLTHSGTGSHGAGASGSHGSSGGGGGLGGKLVGQLAQNLFSSGNKPQAQPQNYHSGQQTTQQQSSGGLAGSMMGGVAHMFGGQSHSSQNQNYGYSNAGQTGGYSGSAPPASYQPSGMPPHQAVSQHTPQGSQPSPSYHTPASSAQPHSTPSYQTSSQQPPNPYSHAPQQHGTPSFPPPPSTQYEGGHQGYPGSAQHSQYSQHGQIPGPPAGQTPAHQYGHPQGMASQYGQSQHGGGYGQQQPPAYGGQQGGYPSYQSPSQSQYPSQSSYGQGPPVHHGSHPGYGSNSQY